MTTQKHIFKNISSGKLLFILPAYTILILLQGCRPDYMNIALTEIDSKKGEVALNYITDQDSLCKIALKARDEYVSFSATKKITNPVLLSRIESQSSSGNVREAASKILKQQGLDIVGKMPFSKKDSLFIIAMETRYEVVAAAAVKKINNPASLAGIAMQNQFSSVRKSALAKLTGKGVTESLAAEKSDQNAILVSKLIKAFDRVPEAHRLRLMDRTIAIIGLLRFPEVAQVTGEITDINVSWEQISQGYTETRNGQNTGYSGTMPGEVFSCTIRVEKISEPLFHKWSTRFPNDGGGRINVEQFESATVNIGDIFIPVLKYLPQASLKKIYEKFDDYNLHLGIVKYLTDLSMLKKICEQEKVGKGLSTLGSAAEKKISAIMAFSPK